MQGTSKIIAIGGGEIGRPGYPVETTAIAKEIIHLSGKQHPRLLFIPTASNDAEGYVATVKEHFGKRLGCRVDTLLLVRERLDRQSVSEKVRRADIIYVGGGNTFKMLQVWKRFGVDKLLLKAHNQGKVMCGLSAGAICWFRYGSSDFRVFQKGRRKDYARVRGLNLVNLTVSPHHIRERKRKAGLVRLMHRTGGIGVALDDFSALEIIGSRFRIITSRPHAGAHRVFFKKGKVYYQPIPKSRVLVPLEVLHKR